MAVDDVRQFCEGKLTTYKHPRRVILIDSVPRTGTTGQIQRRTLTTLAMAQEKTACSRMRPVEAIHIVVATALIPAPVIERMREVVGDGVTVSHAPVPWNDTFAPSAIAPAWVEPLARAHVLVGFPQQISGLAEAAPALRWVQYYGAGYEGAPLDELARGRESVWSRPPEPEPTVSPSSPSWPC